MRLIYYKHETICICPQTDMKPELYVTSHQDWYDTTPICHQTNMPHWSWAKYRIFGMCHKIHSIQMSSGGPNNDMLKFQNVSMGTFWEIIFLIFFKKNIKLTQESLGLSKKWAADFALLLRLRTAYKAKTHLEYKVTSIGVFWV